MRFVWIGLGVTSLLLGVIGIALPFLPTVPFLLLSALCFSKSSPRLHGWLINHPQLGPPIEAWRKSGAISVAAKRWATLSVTVVFGISAIAGLDWKVLSVQAVTLSLVMLFIWTRPAG
jgi:uncharacterized protein